MSRSEQPAMFNNRELRYTLYACGVGALAFAGIAFLTSEVLLTVLFVIAAAIAFDGARPRQGGVSS